jgi:alpha-glucosidase (family GH31 glycosyl hydrolase)
MNLRGKSLEMNNQARYGYGAGVENLNIAIPFVVSSRKYGIYFDHIYPGSISLGSSDGALTYKSDHSALSYYFLASPSMPELMDDYTQLTGKAPLPPRWALGYIQSKFGYENEAEARAIVAQMKNENFPLDALVLDLYWFGDPNDMGNLNWDNSRFPDPETMISDFKEDGVKTILITEPYVTTNSANYNTVINNDLVATDASDAAFVINNFWAGAAVLLDLIDTTAQNWMWQFYQEKIDQGVAGWWCDLGEPENHPLHVQHHGKPAAEVHNYFSWEWSKMLQEKYQEAYPNQRLFNLIRSGYAGMQRFGAIPWSGDIQRSFEGMQIQVPIMINMGYSGVGYMHSDLGGFTGGSQNNELYTRWLQLGTFSPIMRAHGVDIPTEPVFYPDTYKNIVRRFIELRYTLLPYNYSLAYENAVTGAPMARAMDFYDPGNTALHNINDQYFWGEQMLIAPVLEEGASTREVQLPEGKWINYFTNQAYNGNTTITVAAPMETMPVFVKSGSLLPHTKLVSSTDHYLADNFSIWYYPDADQPLSSYTLFNDDGLSPNSLVDGDFELIDLTANYLADSTVIQVRHRGDFLAQPESRILEFRIKNINRIPTEVSINNTIVPTFNDSSMYAVISEAAYYDAAENEVYVHTTWDNTDLEIILKSLFTTRTTRLNKPAATLKVYPTVIDQNATIECTLEKSNTYRLDLVNRFGQIIHTFFNQRGTQTNFTLKWQVNQNISPGLYYLRLSGQKGMKATPVVIMK